MRAIREAIITAAAEASTAQGSEVFAIAATYFGLSSDINKNQERIFPMLFVLPIRKSGAYSQGRRTNNYNVRMMLVENHKEAGNDTDEVFRTELVDKCSDLADAFLIRLRTALPANVAISSYALSEVHNANQFTNYLCSGVLIESTIAEADTYFCL